MKYRTGFIMAAAFLFLQPFAAMLFQGLAIPDLLLCMVLASAIVYDKDEFLPAFVPGTVFVFLRDIVESKYIGTQTLAFIIAVLVVFILRHIISTEDWLPALFIGSVGSFVSVWMAWFLMHMTGNPLGFFHMFSHMFVRVIGDTVVIFIMQIIMKKKRNLDINRNGFFR